MPEGSPVSAIEVRAGFERLLREASVELFEANPDRMSSGRLLPTPNVIDERDAEAFFTGVQAGLIGLERGGKFNTLDRPNPGGRWSLLSRTQEGGWYNAEYLPQLAAYIELILDHGFPCQRVLFELPREALQLDLAVLTDERQVAVLGEAKRDVAMLDRLVDEVEERFAGSPPTAETKQRGDEARQLAWRLWTTRAPYLWLIGPGERRPYGVSYEPLRFVSQPRLPAAEDLGLHIPPEGMLEPPRHL